MENERIVKTDSVYQWINIILPCRTKPNLSVHFALVQYWISCASVSSDVHPPVIWDGLRPPDQEQQQEGKDAELHFVLQLPVLSLH